MTQKINQDVLMQDLQVLRECVVENLTVLGTLTGGGSGAVDSVFSRTGDVVATAGDYNAGQVTLTQVGIISATTVQAGIAEILTDLASNANGLGASQIGIEDSAGQITATQVEAALAELAAVTTQVNGGSNVIASPASGVTLSDELVPHRRFRFDLVDVDITIDAADDFGSVQIATLPAGLLLLVSSRINVTITDQGNLGTLDDVDVAVGTAAVDANDMSTAGSQSILGTVNADSDGDVVEIQLPTGSVGFSNGIFLNMTQMVGSNATARVNGSIEILYIDLKATGDA